MFPVDMTGARVVRRLKSTPVAVREHKRVDVVENVQRVNSCTEQNRRRKLLNARLSMKLHA